MFGKRISFTMRIFKPVSSFMFCSITIVFAILHPSVIFLALLPFLILGYFIKHSYRKCLSITVMIVLSIYLLANYLF
jgi:hypothetical protein